VNIICYALILLNLPFLTFLLFPVQTLASVLLLFLKSYSIKINNFISNFHIHDVGRYKYACEHLTKIVSTRMQKSDI
jgi:hypothetical protein